MAESFWTRVMVAVAALSSGTAELRRREEGQALVEYALILGIIAVAAIAALTVLRDDIVRILNSISNAI